MVEMTKIIGGVVRLNQRICPKQYEHKEANVELTFTVGEGDSYDEVFDKASRAVINRVRVILDLPKLAEPAVIPGSKKPGEAAKTDAPTSTGLFGD